MTAFANLAIDNSIELSGDTLGGSATARVDHSDVYTFTIDLAYLNTAASGALGLVLSMTSSDGARFNSTQWMTSGTAKGGNNFYIDRDGKKRLLPGMETAEHLALLTAGKHFAELEAETKIAKIWDYEVKKEVPQEVNMFMDLVGKKVKLGIIKGIKAKTQKNDSGFYEDTAVCRYEYDIDKVFRARDDMTVTEVLAQATEATFMARWIDKNKDQTPDRRRAATKEKFGAPIFEDANVSSTPTPTASAAPQAAAAPAPAKSLFS